MRPPPKPITSYRHEHLSQSKIDSIGSSDRMTCQRAIYAPNYGSSNRTNNDISDPSRPPHFSLSIDVWEGKLACDGGVYQTADRAKSSDD